jgi:hypothetical protein
VLLPQGLFADLQGLAQQRLGPGIVAQVRVESAEAVQALRVVAILVAQETATDLHQVLGQRNGLVVLALFLERLNLPRIPVGAGQPGALVGSELDEKLEMCEREACIGHAPVVLALEAGQHGQRFGAEGAGDGEVDALLVDLGEPFQRIRDLLVRVAKHLPLDGEHLFGFRNRLGQLAGGSELSRGFFMAIAFREACLPFLREGFGRGWALGARHVGQGRQECEHEEQAKAPAFSRSPRS